MGESWYPLRTSLKELVQGRGAYRVVDVMGRGGGLALGAVQAGLQLAARRDDAAALGFGLVSANRVMLGERWGGQATDPGRWRTAVADVVVSAPPPESAGTVISYAAKLKPAVVVLDFAPGVVDADFAAGLLKGLRKLSQTVYRPTVVQYNDLSLGGALDRPRVFLILSQIPVGVGRVSLDWLPSSWDAVADLLDLEPGWDLQAVRRAPTWYSRSLRSAGHETDGYAEARYHRTVRDWDWSRPGWMLGADGVLRVKGRDDHPITHREIARLMGFPDAWRLGTAPRGLLLGAHWELTTSPWSARWVMQWVRSALDGAPGPLRDEVDVSEDWRAVAARVWPENG